MLSQQQGSTPELLEVRPHYDPHSEFFNFVATFANGFDWGWRVSARAAARTSGGIVLRNLMHGNGFSRECQRVYFEEVSRHRERGAAEGQHRDMLDAEFRQQSRAELLREWGDQYDNNLQLARRALEEEPPGVRSTIVNERNAAGRLWGDDPAMVRTLVERGRRIAEPEVGRRGAVSSAPAGTARTTNEASLTVANFRRAQRELLAAPDTAPVFVGMDFGRAPPMTARMVAEQQELFAYRTIAHQHHLHDGQMAALIGAYFGSNGGGAEEAQAKGLKLLREWLSPEQLAQYDEHQYFDVVGGDTGKRYRIRHGCQMNIEELGSDGAKVCGWCFLPEGHLVAGDVMLAQKIALETNERKALKVANRFDNTFSLMPGAVNWVSETDHYYVRSGMLYFGRDELTAADVSRRYGRGPAEIALAAPPTSSGQ